MSGSSVDLAAALKANVAQLMQAKASGSAERLRTVAREGSALLIEMRQCEGALCKAAAEQAAPAQTAKERVDDAQASLLELVGEECAPQLNAYLAKLFSGRKQARQLPNPFADYGEEADEEARQMVVFADFGEQILESLLFLENVEEVSFYVWPAGAAEPGLLRRVAMKAGSDAAELMRAICPEADDVPFLQMRPLSVLGIPVHLFRISFTGEV